MHFPCLALLFLATLALAIPGPRLHILGELENRARTCVKDGPLNALLSPPLKSAASSFCSKFIQQTTSTVVTQTVTVVNTVTSISPAVTATMTDTAMVTLTATTTVPVQEPEVTSTETDTVTKTVLLKKRSPAPAGQIPPFLLAFASSQLSSACSCFVTPLPPTSTNIGTISTTVTPTTTVYIPGSTVTSDVTLTVVATTVVVTDLNTLPPSTTDVSVLQTVTVTALPSPVCSSGAQIIKNPGFEQVSGNQPINWVLAPEFEPVQFDAYGVAESGNYAIDGNADPVGNVTGTYTQVLDTLCVGATYTLSMYVGIYNYGLAPSVHSTIEVTIGNTVLVPTQLSCQAPGAADCNLNPEGNQGVQYRQITASFTATAQLATISLISTFDTPPNTQQSDQIIDNVMLTQN